VRQGVKNYEEKNGNVTLPRPLWVKSRHVQCNRNVCFTPKSRHHAPTRSISAAPSQSVGEAAAHELYPSSVTVIRWPTLAVAVLMAQDFGPVGVVGGVKNNLAGGVGEFDHARHAMLRAITPGRDGICVDDDCFPFIWDIMLRRGHP
jgi:hypothetical protein